eukprot:6311092-Pyramimonas_sp.AAC.1
MSVSRPGARTADVVSRAELVHEAAAGAVEKYGPRPAQQLRAQRLGASVRVLRVDEPRRVHLRRATQSVRQSPRHPVKCNWGVYSELVRLLQKTPSVCTCIRARSRVATCRVRSSFVHYAIRISNCDIISREFRGCEASPGCPGDEANFTK